MSWSIYVVGRNKEKLKEVVRAEQCRDEEKQPHSGAPARVVDYLCKEIDRIRIYEWENKTFGIRIVASGSFHEQGCNESIDIQPTRLVE